MLQKKGNSLTCATSPAEEEHAIRSKAPEQLLHGLCGEIVKN